MPEWPLSLRLATQDDMERVVQLIEDAADWLRTQGTDQWAKPWPTRAARDRRIMTHILADQTWIAWDADIPAATITADPRADLHWPAHKQRDPAVYVHRLVVNRRYAGMALGAGLLDWAGELARRRHGSHWIRLNAWTTNFRLHQYYRGLGFQRCEAVETNGYPSAAFFQRPARQTRRSPCSLFTVEAPD
jgi:GNAT superfamily N-acetyltransferase